MANSISDVDPMVSPSPSPSNDAASMHPLFLGESPTKVPGPSSLVNRPVWGQRTGSFVDYSVANAASAPSRPRVYRTKSTDAADASSSSSPAGSRAAFIAQEEDAHVHQNVAAPFLKRSNIPRTGRVSSYDLQFDDADESQVHQDSLFGRLRPSSPDLFGPDIPKSTGHGVISPNQTPMAKRSQRTFTKAGLGDSTSSFGDSGCSAPNSRPGTASGESRSTEETRQINYRKEWLATLHDLSDSDIQRVLSGANQPKESTPVKFDVKARDSQTQYHVMELIRALSKALAETQTELGSIRLSHGKQHEVHEQLLDRLNQESETRENALTTLCLEHGIKQGEIQRSLLRAPVLDAEILKRKRIAQKQSMTSDKEVGVGNKTAPALPQSIQQAMLEGIDGLADTSHASLAPEVDTGCEPCPLISPSIRSSLRAESVDADGQPPVSPRPSAHNKNISIKSSSTSIKSDASTESGTGANPAKRQAPKYAANRNLSSSVPASNVIGDWASGLLPWAATGASQKAGATAVASNVKAISPGRKTTKDKDKDDFFVAQLKPPLVASKSVAKESPRSDSSNKDKDKDVHVEDKSTMTAMHGQQSSLAAASTRKDSKSGLGILGNLAWRRKKEADPLLQQSKSRNDATESNLKETAMKRERPDSTRSGTKDRHNAIDPAQDLAKPLAVRSSSNEVPMLLHEAITFENTSFSPGGTHAGSVSIPLSLLPKSPHFRAIVLATRVLNSDPGSIFQESKRTAPLVSRLGVDLVRQARLEGKLIEDAPKRKNVLDARPVSLAQLHLSKTATEEQSKRKGLALSSGASSTAAPASVPDKTTSATTTTFVRTFGRYARASPVRDKATPPREPNVTRLPDTYHFNRDADVSLTLSETSEQMLTLASPRPPNSAVELESMLPSNATPPTMIRRKLKSRKSSRKSDMNNNRESASFNKNAEQPRTPKFGNEKHATRLSFLSEESSGDEFEVYGGKGPVPGFTQTTGNAAFSPTSAKAKVAVLSKALEESETDSDVEEEVQVLTDRYGFIYNATDADIRLLRQARKATAPPSSISISANDLAGSQSDEDNDQSNQIAENSDDDIFDLTANGIRLQRDRETASIKSPTMKPRSGQNVSPYSTDTASITDGNTSNEDIGNGASFLGSSERLRKQKKKQNRNLLTVSHSKPAVAKVLPISASSQPASSNNTPEQSGKRKTVARAADFASSSGSPAKRTLVENGLPSISNTVRLLLTQLKDMHEAEQSERKTKWDKFLLRRKVQLQQTNNSGIIDNGVVTENLSVARVLGSVEKAPEEDWSSGLVGVNRMGDSKSGKEDWREFLSLCQTGIPVCYRAKIWAECSGANDLAEPGRYQELLSEHTGEINACLTQIDLDVHRTMPTNIFFGGDGQGIPKLRRLLVAFSWYNPDTGYCQGMNNLAATLLLTHATEEEAFWVLVCIIEKILPSEYYSSNLLVSQADQRVLTELVEEHMPQLHQHLVDLDVYLPAITFAWFLSLYTDCLPVETLFRIWDVMFVEGMVILFRVAMAILKMHETELLGTTSAASLYGLARSLTSRLFSVDKLIHLTCNELKTTIRYASILEKRERHVAGKSESAYQVGK